MFNFRNVGVLCFLALSILVGGFSEMASGQTGRGAIAGSVADALGGSLQGAKIALNPGDVTATSDPTGQFTFRGVASGNSTLTVSYTGFADFTTPDTLSNRPLARVDSVLSAAANKDTRNVYAGPQGGELEADDRTFHADNTINDLHSYLIT